MMGEVNRTLLNVVFALSVNMVFNVFMEDNQLTLEQDRATIARLGGPTVVADLLGYDKSAGGVQRVQNWLKRGIPPRVKLERPDLFPNARATGRKYGRRKTDRKTEGGAQ